MSDKSKMDCRTQKEILNETTNSALELQEVIGIMFPWKILLHDNEITINNNTVQLIIKYIRLQKGETK